MLGICFAVCDPNLGLPTKEDPELVYFREKRINLMNEIIRSKKNMEEQLYTFEEAKKKLENGECMGIQPVENASTTQYIRKIYKGESGSIYADWHSMLDYDIFQVADNINLSMLLGKWRLIPFPKKKVKWERFINLYLTDENKIAGSWNYLTKEEAMISANHSVGKFIKTIHIVEEVEI